MGILKQSADNQSEINSAYGTLFRQLINDNKSCYFVSVPATFYVYSDVILKLFFNHLV